jgi:hypothetical protein
MADSENGLYNSPSCPGVLFLFEATIAAEVDGIVNRRPKLTPYRRATLTPLGAYWEQAAIERASNSAVASERLAVVRPGF